MNFPSIVVLAGVVLQFCMHGVEARAEAAKVKVFILAGQSNMEGYGMLRSLEQLGRHPKYGKLLETIRTAEGSLPERDDVTIYWGQDGKEPRHGLLNSDWGALTGESVGPDQMFGAIMGDHFDEHVLLIKTAWGGKSVWCDFRSPSAGEMTWDESRILKRDDWLQPGRCYRQMVADVKHCLGNIEHIVPNYKGQGYELAGMAWLQGWNDYCEWHLQLNEKPVGKGLIKRYSHNLAAMIRDFRDDLNAPELRVAIGELGVFGDNAEERATERDDHEAMAMVEFREAQRRVGDETSLGNVAIVPTADLWDPRLQELRVMADRYWQVKQRNGVGDTDANVLPTKELNDEYWQRGGHWVCHYNGSATTYCLVGYRLAKALLEDERNAPRTDRGASHSNRSRLHLKVDFAPPLSQTNPRATPGTAKPGWWHWVMSGNWDFYRSDLTWENGTSRFSADGPGIADSGVHAAITCHYEGLLTYYVAGMRRYLAGGIQPVGRPIHEPICNSWVAASDFPNSPSSDLLLGLYDLPAGAYRLLSYHNSFNCRRIGDDPTGVECDRTTTPEPPMPSIRVYSLETLAAEYFGSGRNALVKGKTYGTSLEKIALARRQGRGVVRQTGHAHNVVIQQVKTDAELRPSTIEFTTDGSPVVVVYASGTGKRDDLRPHRRGGYAVLNAFELIQLSQASAAP